MVAFRNAGLPALLLLSGCTGSVTFFSSIDQRVDLDAYTGAFVQQNLADFSTLASVPCPSPGNCQDAIDSTQLGGDLVLRCNAAQLCDPDPYTLALDLGVQDLEDLADPQIRVVDDIELLDVLLEATSNTTNTPLPPFEIRWGSASASAANYLTTSQPLALVGGLPPGATGPVPVTLVPESLDALDTYVDGTSAQIRFFVVTALDLEPGQPLPAGALDLRVRLRVRATGQVR